MTGIVTGAYRRPFAKHFASTSWTRCVMVPWLPLRVLAPQPSNVTATAAAVGVSDLCTAVAPPRLLYLATRFIVVLLYVIYQNSSIPAVLRVMMEISQKNSQRKREQRTRVGTRR